VSYVTVPIKCGICGVQFKEHEAVGVYFVAIENGVEVRGAHDNCMEQRPEIRAESLRLAKARIEDAAKEKKS